MLFKLKLLMMIGATTALASYGGALVGGAVNCMRASGEVSIQAGRVACAFNYDGWTASRQV